MRGHTHVQYRIPWDKAIHLLSLFPLKHHVSEIRPFTKDLLQNLAFNKKNIRYRVYFYDTKLVHAQQNHTKRKITKILHSEENSNRQVPIQMAKSNNKTHQTNEQQLSYS